MGCMKLIRVVIADVDRVYRKELRGYLANLPGIRLVGEAVSPEEVVFQATKCSPHVLLLDSKLGARGGDEAVCHITKLRPDLGVIALTESTEVKLISTLLQAGVRGFLLKGRDEAALLTALLAVADGQALFGSGVAAHLPAIFATLPAAIIAAASLSELTPREQSIAGLIAQGLSNQEIAEKLTLCNKTVRNSSTRIFKKLGVANRQQAILAIRSWHLGQLPQV
jgi:DNA-binding NarL/FixJ family response regulator